MTLINTLRTTQDTVSNMMTSSPITRAMSSWTTQQLSQVSLICSDCSQWKFNNLLEKFFDIFPYLQPLYQTCIFKNNSFLWQSYDATTEFALLLAQMLTSVLGGNVKSSYFSLLCFLFSCFLIFNFFQSLLVRRGRFLLHRNEKKIKTLLNNQNTIPTFLSEFPI